MSKVFSGVRAKWLPLYEELQDMAEHELGAFEKRETSSAVLWRHSSSFAELSAKSGCLVVAFASDTLHDEWEPAKALQTSKNRVVHYFEVSDNTLFPTLIERIKAAYTLTKPCKAPKQVRQAQKTYEYDAVIHSAEIGKGGAYVHFPNDIRAEFGKGRVKVHATFDGESYEGSIVNMGVKNADGSVCYIIGILKDIRAVIGKQPGDSVHVTVSVL